MNLDFHTHGKLAKYLPFSPEYTDWLLGEAKKAGLDAICLTEHFNTKQFDELYGYIAAAGDRCGDAWIFDGLKVFPGMETDIAEGGHVLSIGPMDAIRELNRRLEPYKQKENFLTFARLSELFAEYPVLVGAGHPFRKGGHIPGLPEELLEQLQQRSQTVTKTETSVSATEKRSVQESEVRSLNQKVAVQNAEDIQALVNRTLSKQMNRITDQVYQQMEKRLQKERFRRGRF